MKRILLAGAVLALAACGSPAHRAPAASPAPAVQLLAYCDVTFPDHSLVQPPVQPGPAGYVMDVQLTAGSHVYVRTLTILVIAGEGGTEGHDETVTERVGKTVGPDVNGAAGTVVSFPAPDTGHGWAPGGCQAQEWTSSAGQEIAAVPLNR